MPNSATLVQALIAAFCAILCALSGMGGGGMSLIMRRNLMSAKSGPTAKDYVQNGLISMWDGIENAGWGVHDPNATVWKDLGNGTLEGLDSGRDALLTSAGRWGEDCLICDGSIPAAISYGKPFKRSSTSKVNPFVVEAVFNVKTPEYPTYIFHPSKTARNFGFACLLFSKNTSDLCIGCIVGEKGYDVSDIMSRRFSFVNRIYVYSDTSGNAYIDGKDVESSSTSSNNRYLTPNYTGFGGRPTSESGGDMAISCEICAVRLYTSVFTEDDRMHNYAIDRLRFNIPETT